MKKFLIIDDQPENLITHEAVLKSFMPDCEIITALSGAEGIEKSVVRQPDIILLDIVMPGMDGYLVCSSLKSNPQTKNTLILLVTARKTDTLSRAKGLEAGADAFLSKPYDTSEYIAQIKVLLRLKDTEDQLRKEKKLVEAKVDERTQELQEANVMLSLKIEELTTADQELVESKHRLETIMNSSLEGFWVSDLKGNLLEVNDTLCQMTGYTNEELIRMKIADLEAVETEDEVIRRISTIVKQGELRFESRHRKKDGSVFDVEVSTQFYPKGNRCFTFIRDITVLNITRSKLFENEQRYRTLFDLSPSGILLIDLSGNIIDANDSFCRSVQYSSNELIGQHIGIIADDKNSKIVANHIHLMELGELLHHEVKNIKKDGTICYLELKESLIVLPDGKKGILSVSHDITLRKQTEAELNRARHRADKQRNAISRIATDELIISSDMHKALERLSEIAAEAIETECVGVWMFNPDRSKLECITKYSLTEGVNTCGKVLDRDEMPDYFEYIERENRLYVSDISTDPNTQKYLSVLKQTNNLISMLDAGFHVEGELTGIVCFEHCGEKRVWYADEEAFVSTISSLVAQIIVNNNRRQAKQALRINEQRLRSLINSTPDYIVFKDAEGRWMEANTAAIDLFSLSNVRYQGKTDVELSAFTDAIYRSVFLGCELSDKKAWDSGNMIREEEVISNPITGEVETFDTIKVPVVNPDGSRQGLVILGRNISKRKHAEEQMRVSEQRFRQLFEKLGDAVFVTKLDGADFGRILEVNPAAESQTGYTRNELLEKNILTDIRLFGEADAEIEKWTGKLLSGNNVNAIEKKRRKDGTEYWTEVVITPIDYNGMKASLSINHDITKRKRNEQVQEIIYNISRAVVTTMDLKSFYEMIRVELGKIIDTTNFFIAFYDELKDELTFPIYFDQRDHYDKAPASRTLTKYMIEKGKPLLADVEFKLKLASKGKLVAKGSFSKVWLGVPLRSDGRINGAIVVQSYSDEKAYTQSDVGILEFVADQIGLSIERKRAESELLKALEKAEESDRLKSAFLANMSHEIRTPMNGILGFAELLKQPGLDGDEQQEFIEIIEKSGRRMLNIINDIVDISRIEAGQMKVNMHETNVVEQIDYIYTFFKPEAENKGIALLKKVDIAGSDKVIKTDREKVFAILTNLVKNAIKYTKEGTIEIGVSRENDLLKFYIRDTGIGIPDDRQEAVFERFIQADIADTQAYEGAGLGLAITKAYVQLLGGRIWVQSNQHPDSHGSVFYFTLPMQVKLENKDAEMVDADENLTTLARKLNIILAEDDPASQRLLTYFLKGISKQIIPAVTGTEAVALCRAHPEVDLVLMDVKMPELNGYEATKAIRAFNPEVIIIAQTAFGLSGDREKALAAGCNEYLPKPIDKKLLMSVIDRFFG